MTILCPEECVLCSRMFTHVRLKCPAASIITDLLPLRAGRSNLFRPLRIGVFLLDQLCRPL